MVENVTGCPKEPVPNQRQRRAPAYAKKYEADAQPATFVPQPPPAIPNVRSWRIMKSDIIEHGPTEGCPGCKAIVRGSLIRAGHTDQCRQRIYDLIHDEEYGRARIERAAARAAGAADQSAPRQEGGEDVPNVKRCRLEGMKNRPKKQWTPQMQT